MPPIPGIRVVTASGWWTPKMELEQSMFVSAELVQIKTHLTPEMSLTRLGSNTFLPSLRVAWYLQ